MQSLDAGTASQRIRSGFLAAILCLTVCIPGLTRTSRKQLLNCGSANGGDWVVPVVAYHTSIWTPACYSGPVKHQRKAWKSSRAQ